LLHPDEAMRAITATCQASFIRLLIIINRTLNLSQDFNSELYSSREYKERNFARPAAVLQIGTGPMDRTSWIADEV
jgi:hypothetical protein